MGKRDDLIAHYAKDLEEKFEMMPDMKLRTAVTLACGPSIYNNDSSTVSATQKKELETVKKSFLIKKLGLKDSPKLDEGIAAVMDIYGRSVRKKYRAVVYYLLVKHFRKASLFK